MSFKPLHYMGLALYQMQTGLNWWLEKQVPVDSKSQGLLAPHCGI